MGVWDDLKEIFGNENIDNPEAAKFDYSKWKLPPGGVKKRASQAVINKRRDLVSALILTGVTQREIAERLGVGISTIETDYRALMKEWRHNSIDNVQEHAIKNLQRLEMIIGQCVVRMIQGIDFHESGQLAGKCIQEQGIILGYRSAGVQVDVTEYVLAIAEAQGLDPEEAMQVANKIAGTLK